ARLRNAARNALLKRCFVCERSIVERDLAAIDIFAADDNPPFIRPIWRGMMAVGNQDAPRLQFGGITSKRTLSNRNFGGHTPSPTSCRFIFFSSFDDSSNIASSRAWKVSTFFANCFGVMS